MKMKIFVSMIFSLSTSNTQWVHSNNIFGLHVRCGGRFLCIYFTYDGKWEAYGWLLGVDEEGWTNLTCKMNLWGFDFVSIQQRSQNFGKSFLFGSNWWKITQSPPWLSHWLYFNKKLRFLVIEAFMWFNTFYSIWINFWQSAIFVASLKNRI